MPKHVNFVTPFNLANISCRCYPSDSQTYSYAIPVPFRCHPLGVPSCLVFPIVLSAADAGDHQQTSHKPPQRYIRFVVYMCVIDISKFIF